jgi:rhodanese-related sulfurtransferase
VVSNRFAPILMVLAWLMCPVLSMCAHAAHQIRDSFDAGQLDLNAAIQHSFVLPSVGKRRRPIKSVKSSCECVVVQHRPDAIVPEKTGHLVVNITPDSIGEFAYEIEIQFEDQTVTPWVFIVFANVRAAGFGASNYISPTALNDALDRADAPAVIDIRKEGRFREARIPNSLSIPAHAVRFKTWLQSRDLVLVGACEQGGAAEALCSQLMSTGFRSVKVLEGGIAAWEENGGALDGQPSAIAKGASVPHNAPRLDALRADSRGSGRVIRIKGGQSARRRCGCS